MATTAPPTATSEPPRHAVFHRLVVEDVAAVTDDAIAITFAVPEHLAPAYRFTQGQHVALVAPEVGDGIRRNYSICAPATSGRLRVAVKALPGGAFSTWAHTELRPGDALEVMTPAGRFFTPLDPTQAKRYTAIAAGSGITPILSILATTLEVEPASTCTLVYQNRTTASIMFLEELEDLKNRYPDRLELVHVLSREPQPVELFEGRLDGAKLSALLGALIPPEVVDEWFVCGPGAMADEVRSTLVDHGVAPARIHRERFHSEPAPDRRPGPAPAPTDGTPSRQVTVRLDGRASTFPLGPDQVPILDAALAVRPDAPFACKEGVCGTCRARLVEGTVRMDHPDALEADEVAAGFVLACQSHPTSDRVVLDFDQ
ncbi:MAG TPA: 1,2-phenylacetyl-CoA epoxidase subunit PaaE [Acidimicrobiales bacterium]|nr:1,2-phenylacetyl-CoA epoxidase subunit PaaE [Acidimicrobiales bacterium]